MDDATAIALANALVGNNILTELNLNYNENITSCRSSVFLRALCNPQTIMSTFQFNYTLRTLENKRYRPSLNWEDINTVLCLNRESSKSKEACLKTTRTHFCKGFLLPPFVDMDLEVLPRAIAWVGRHIAGGPHDDRFC